MSKAAQAAEQRPLSIGGDFRRGRTPFDRLDATAKIAQGTASIEDVRLEGGAIRLTLGGLASIPSRDLDLKGTATLVSGHATPRRCSSCRSWCRDRGTIRSCCRRAEPDPPLGAAAPLLEAVRDRKTRDTLRTVIDQLDRDGVVPPAGRP